MPRPVAAITGAGSSISTAIAQRFALHHDLVLAHLNADNGILQVSEQAQRAGAQVVTVIGDLTAILTIAGLRSAVDAAAGRLQVLVSNAGAYPRIPWDALDVVAFRRQLEVNLVAHMACVRLVTPALMTAREGRIVATSTVLTQLGRVDLAGYIATKDGLEALIRALAREHGPHGVTVNCVRAGSIEVLAEGSVVPDHSAIVKRQLDWQSIKRRGQPDDVAAAVEFLASPQAGLSPGDASPSMAVGV